MQALKNLIWMVLSNCTAEIYFPSDTYNYLLGPDTEVNTTVAEVIALFKNLSQHTDDIVYSLEAVRLEGNCTAKSHFNGEVQELFAIENYTNGRIVQTRKLAPYTDYKGCAFKLLVSASMKVPINEEIVTKKSIKAHSSLTSMSNSPTTEADKVKTVIQLDVSQDSTVCFAKTDLRLQIFLSTPPGLVYVLNPRPSPGGYRTGNSYEYELVEDNVNNHFAVNNKSSALTLLRTEAEVDIIYFSVRCSIKSTTKSDILREQFPTQTIGISVTVLAEHDDLLTPIFPEKLFLEVTEKRIQNQRLLTLKPSKTITYGWTWPELSVSSHEENTSRFYAADVREFQLPNDVIIDFLLQENLPYTMETIHNINVTIWNNQSMQTPTNWTDIPARTIIIYQFEVTVHRMKFKFENSHVRATVYRNASTLSRVAINAVPPYVSAGRIIFYNLQLSEFLGDAIRLEERSGILYVDNTTELQTLGYTHFNLTVYARDLTYPFNEPNDVSSVEIVVRDADPPTCTPYYCAQHPTKERCTSNCGLGAPTGWCQWRPDKSKELGVGYYGTCSPDVSTCPDGICDEIEYANPQVCMQDCTANSVGFRNTGRLGILVGFGICKCDMLNDMRSHCSCFQPYPELTPTPAVNLSTVNPCLLSLDLCAPENNGYKTVVVESNAGPCDIVCIIVLSSVGFVFMALIVVGLFVSKRYPCSGRVAGTQYKPGLIGTADGLLNTVPSEYVDDGFMLQRIKSEFDAKWEFPRTNLVLEEEILGEGEFGRVMMAQALNIRGHTGYQTVAVKMLKNNATNAELQDLITELSLLKQVNHPNVIRLLGASTQKGPLFVIVEYCKHGSLKMFLRQNRKTTHVNEDYIATDPEPSPVSIGPRTLMSFAWQICKGMHYLTTMKLVHRDLAARNVLVAEGLIVKISDFGLTRDIYEGDTYMKKSKSRMPVKWMAIEALYDNIYTIKSDVWSFGVLLWEIVTMGATPYPGLPSERLYQILKNGYRMDKPDGCSDELFRIMQRCWQLVPASRPSFFDLADIFEKMLEKDSEYLDLSAELPIDSDDEDKEDNAGTGALFRPNQQVNEEDETSLKVLLNNASYTAIPGACNKSNETSFTGSPTETEQERIGEEDSYYCGEYTQTETV